MKSVEIYVLDINVKIEQYSPNYPAGRVRLESTQRGMKSLQIFQQVYKWGKEAISEDVISCLL